MIDQPFYFFFGLLGLVVGGVLVWMFVAEHPFETKEEPWYPSDPLEAGFLAEEMTKRGHDMDEETVSELLELHTSYLEGRIREEQAHTEDLLFESARDRAAAEREAEEEPAAVAVAPADPPDDDAAPVPADGKAPAKRDS